MKIRRILNPVAQENTYILENDTACLVIDPGSDTSSILAELKSNRQTGCCYPFDTYTLRPHYEC